MPAKESTLPPGFVYLKQIAPSIPLDIKYYTSDNLVGVRLDGYLAPTCILTLPAANALAALQAELEDQGLSLLVYDGYRPTQAVDHFYRWSIDSHDQKNKAIYYPNINKALLFEKGYIAHKSSHSRGSTVDLTLIDLRNQQPLDMGTSFDFMDPLSHPGNQAISQSAYCNRQRLMTDMQKYGFIGIETEWWHYTLQNEPYPDQYFNFPVR